MEGLFLLPRKKKYYYLPPNMKEESGQKALDKMLVNIYKSRMPLKRSKMEISKMNKIDGALIIMLSFCSL